MARAPFQPAMGFCPGASGGGVPYRTMGGPDSPAACPICPKADEDGHPNRPHPNYKTGALYVDPDLVLTAKHFGLSIEFHYGSDQQMSTEFGANRTASTRCQVLSPTLGSRVTVQRGNFTDFGFDRGLLGNYTPVSDSGVTTTLEYDSGSGQFIEYFPEGYQMKYGTQVATSGGIATHQVTSVEQANGVKHTYTYGTGAEAGLLKNIELPGGHLVTFAYAASTGTSLLNTIKDFGGRTWTFQYNSDRALTTLTEALGCQTLYGHTSVSGGPVTLLNSIQDPRGFVTDYFYGALNRVASMSAGGAVWTFVYDDVSNISSMTTPSGALTTFHFTGNRLTSRDRPEGYTETFVYSNQLLVQRKVPSGTNLSVTYDTNLWQISASDDALGNRTSFQYDSFGNMTTLTDANGKVWTNVSTARARPSSRLPRSTRSVGAFPWDITPTARLRL